MNAQVQKFFRHVETRIASERSLADQPGIRPTARIAAAARASALSADLLYLRAAYGNERVMVGEADGQ